jgi:hypothetical protein
MKTVFDDLSADTIRRMADMAEECDKKVSAFLSALIPLEHVDLTPPTPVIDAQALADRELVRALYRMRQDVKDILAGTPPQAHGIDIPADVVMKAIEDSWQQR